MRYKMKASCFIIHLNSSAGHFRLQQQEQRQRQAHLWMGPSDLLQNASKTKPAVKSQRLTGRIITTGAFSSVTLLLLQPGSLTHLRHLLLLACNSIWSSHASVKGLKPWL